jgi:hypothetical protein
MNVSRETFVAFIKRNPHLVATPVEGTTIAAMQYLDSDGKVIAQAIYSRPVQIPGVKVIPSYVICGKGV